MFVKYIAIINVFCFIHTQILIRAVEFILLKSGYHSKSYIRISHPLNIHPRNLFSEKIK